jgi:4-hydroxy-3-polyprenylbenzoate decarboxylase
MSDDERRLVVAITGASGSIYAVRFLEAVLDYYDRIYLTMTENAAVVLRTELGIGISDEETDGESLVHENHGKIHVFRPHELTAPPSSGSVHHEGMVIIPCSMGTAGRIASGVSNDLVTRAADVCLKERRPLVMVVRETPLNLIHLRNLTSLAEAGATVLPASPSFYSHPLTVEDLVNTVVARTMQQLGLKQTIAPEWVMP